MNSQKRFLILIILAVSLVLLVVFLNNIPPSKEISNFDECVAAGYPVAESYPRQCRTPEGELFVEEISLGGQRDSYGCLIAAGYSWNEEISACVREWEKSLREYQSLNSEDCKILQIVCSEDKTPFYDATGCGCELGTTTQKDVCKPTDRQVEACITLYQPVCGMPLKQTFSNSCFACQNPEVIYYLPENCE
ncbi:hypothetical protein FJZ20_00445 [Candidatus Pacearchaeota archaeon]|nr:hypothetical protein [Candidatus Pacearchaeota archaeon]